MPQNQLDLFPYIPNLPGISLYELLNKMLESMVCQLKAPFVSALTKDLHILPDFHGNRYDPLISIYVNASDLLTSVTGCCFDCPDIV